MSASKRKKLTLPRRQWTRNPVQKAHSSPKGKKGYEREEERKRIRREMDAS
jgi:hypothetical protein